jgi:hypothetical protein
MAEPAKREFHGRKREMQYAHAPFPGMARLRGCRNDSKPGGGVSSPAAFAGPQAGAASDFYPGNFFLASLRAIG